jgi:hypothetical protein
MIVKLKKPDTRYRDLTSGQLYDVIGIEADELRIINNAGRPFLYPPDLFSLVDAREPLDWVTEFGDDGERYSYPPLLNRLGFFEDFFDQKAKAVETFWRVLNHRLAESELRDDVSNLKQRARMPEREKSALIESSKLTKKNTARIVCANANEFWTTQTQFWKWVREGLVDVTGQNPLSGKFAGRRDKLLVMIRHTILDTSRAAGKQKLLGGYSRLKPQAGAKHRREEH